MKKPSKHLISQGSDHFTGDLGMVSCRWLYHPTTCLWLSVKVLQPSDFTLGRSCNQLINPLFDADCWYHFLEHLIWSWISFRLFKGMSRIIQWPYQCNIAYFFSMVRFSYTSEINHKPLPFCLGAFCYDVKQILGACKHMKWDVCGKHTLMDLLQSVGTIKCICKREKFPL